MKYTCGTPHTYWISIIKRYTDKILLLVLTHLLPLFERQPHKYLTHFEYVREWQCKHADICDVNSQLTRMQRG